MNPLCAMFVAVALAAPQQPDQAPPPLDLAPLIPPQPAPPLVKVTVDVGVFLQNDGLDAPAAARVAEGLRGVAKNAPLLTRPAQPCSDDACWAALGASQKVDRVLLASYAKGAMKLQLIDVAAKKTTASAEQPAVPADSAAATAW